MNHRHIYMYIVSNAQKQAELGLRPKTKSQKKKFPNQYFEFHHILPKSLFPLWKDRKSNIVSLTAREHFFCHQLLTKIYPNHSMVSALWHLINRINFKENTRIKITSREYEKIKIEFSKVHSKQQKENSSSLGSHWYTNGIENVKAKVCPDGFRPGRCGRERLVNKESKNYQKLFNYNQQKLTYKEKIQLGLIQVYAKETTWINNGKNCKMVKKDELEIYLKEGWSKGRILKKDPEKLKEMGRRASERWKQDKEWREKQIEIKKAAVTDERRKLVSEQAKRMWENEEYRKNRINKWKEFFASDENRRKFANHFKGKQLD